MELSRTRIGLWKGATGVLGAVLIGCTACCIPLLAPAIGWLAVAGIGLTGPYGVLAGAVAAVVLGLAIYGRRRRRLQRQPCACGTATSCAASCSIET